MFRFLKYIFLVFGLLAILIAGFFAYNNRHDLKLAYKARNELSFGVLAKSCPVTKLNHSAYSCLRPKLEEYMYKASLTGVSLGLKMAFNFLDEDKEITQFSLGSQYKDIFYTLIYLELNNLAIRESHKRYFGPRFMYSGYISSLNRFNEKAFEFSENLIDGLKGSAGLEVIKDEQEKIKLKQKLAQLEKDFMIAKEMASHFINKEVERLTAQHEK